MFILLGRILLWVFFSSFVVAAGCYVVAKIREKGPSLKTAKKIEEKKMKKYQKQAQKQVEKQTDKQEEIEKNAELEQSTQSIDDKTLIYGHGKITTNNNAWREYMQKLINNGYLEETLYEEESELASLKVSAMNAETAENNIKLNFMGNLEDINDICSMNQDVNGNILAPFEVGDEVVVAKNNKIINQYKYLEISNEQPNLFKLKKTEQEIEL